MAEQPELRRSTRRRVDKRKGDRDTWSFYDEDFEEVAKKKQQLVKRFGRQSSSSQNNEPHNAYTADALVPTSSLVKTEDTLGVDDESNRRENLVEAPQANASNDAYAAAVADDCTSATTASATTVPDEATSGAGGVESLPNLSDILQELRSRCAPEILKCLQPLERFTFFAPCYDELLLCGNRRNMAAAVTFYDRLNELVEYQQEHGHTNVPQKHGKLGIWVNKIRQHKKMADEGGQTNLLNPFRRRWLEHLNFDWGDTRGDTKWFIRFQELKNFRDTTGHCNVPTKAHQLGRWVSQQRKEYKNFKSGKPSVMTEERIRLLDQIGFRWDMYCPALEQPKTNVIVF